MSIKDEALEVARKIVDLQPTPNRDGLTVQPDGSINLRGGNLISKVVGLSNNTIIANTHDDKEGFEWLADKRTSAAFKEAGIQTHYTELGKTTVEGIENGRIKEKDFVEAGEKRKQQLVKQNLSNVSPNHPQYQEALQQINDVVQNQVNTNVLNLKIYDSYKKAGITTKSADSGVHGSGRMESDNLAVNLIGKEKSLIVYGISHVTKTPEEKIDMTSFGFKRNIPQGTVANTPSSLDDLLEQRQGNTVRVVALFGTVEDYKIFEKWALSLDDAQRKQADFPDYAIIAERGAGAANGFGNEILLDIPARIEAAKKNISIEVEPPIMQTPPNINYNFPNDSRPSKRNGRS